MLQREVLENRFKGTDAVKRRTITPNNVFDREISEPADVMQGDPYGCTADRMTGFRCGFAKAACHLKINFAIVIAALVFSQRNSDLAIQKIRLIVSPVSRPSWVKKFLPSVLDILKGGGVEVDVCTTQRQGDPTRLAREVEGSVDAVLVAGGDGSINETINALAGSATPIGILPFGTVNVLAREMGIPLRPKEAARAFLSGRVESFDLGRMGDRRFLLMASYGFDARILRSTPSWLKRIFGRYAYLIASFFLIPSYKNAPLQVVSENRDQPRTAHFAIFSNSKCYAGNYVVAPDADMQDAQLDVTFFDCPGRIGLFRIFFAISLSRLEGKPWITRVRTPRLKVKPHARELFQVDGDPIVGEGDTISVEAGGIRVVVPR